MKDQLRIVAIDIYFLLYNFYHNVLQFLLIDWLIDWLIDLLIDLTDWLFDWLKLWKTRAPRSRRESLLLCLWRQNWLVRWKCARPCLLPFRWSNPFRWRWEVYGDRFILGFFSKSGWCGYSWDWSRVRVTTLNCERLCNVGNSKTRWTRNTWRWY